MKKKFTFSKVWEKTKEFAGKIGRKNIIIISSVLLIGVAIYLNYIFFKDTLKDIGYGSNNMEDNYIGAGEGNQDVGAQGEEDYFDLTALSRRRARDEALEVLQTVLSSEEALEVTKEQALEDISRIALEIEQESNIESLILSKGFEQCVAVINGTTARIVVKAEEILPNKLSQIYEIVYEQAGIIPVNVKVNEKS